MAFRRRTGRAHHLAWASAKKPGGRARCAPLCPVQIHLSQAATCCKSPAVIGAVTYQLHRVLDVHFAEDANRARKEKATDTLAIPRRLALNTCELTPTALPSGGK